MLDFRSRLLVAICSVTVLTLGAGCAKPDAPEKSSSSADFEMAASSVGTVEVSNYPLAYVVERLAGPLVEIRFQAANEPDPAYWQPTAEEVLAMQEADLIVVNGAGYEPWLQDVSLPTSRLVDTTADVTPRLIPLDAHLTHSHGSEGEHEHGGVAFTTWLDPTLLLAQAEAVESGLARTWPEHAAAFSQGLAGLATDLEQLDARLAAITAGAADVPVVFSHPVYQYLERRYGLAGESLHWEPNAAPDETQWKELERTLSETGASWMIWEAEPLPEVSERLASHRIESIVVEPCATPPEAGDLLDVLQRNAAALEDVYGSRPQSG